MPEEIVEFVPPDLGVRQRFVRGFCPTPASPEYKLEVLRAYRQWSGAKVFVETGTYRGYTTSYMQPEFEKVYTIELHAERVKQAREKFADCPNVKVIEGNSGEDRGGAGGAGPAGDVLARQPRVRGGHGGGEEGVRADSR
jgi:hypothetical protein